MSQQENRVADSHFSDWGEAPPLDERDIVRLSAARARAMDEAGNSIARQLNGPLTALLLYMEELKHHSHRFSPDAGERDHLQKVVQNALQQTERVCALVKEIAGNQPRCRGGAGGQRRMAGARRACGRRTVAPRRPCCRRMPAKSR